MELAHVVCMLLLLALIHVVQSAEVARNTNTQGHTFAHQRLAMQKLLSECKAVTSNSAMNRAGFNGALEVEITKRSEIHGVVTCCLSAAFRVLCHVIADSENVSKSLVSC